MLIGGHVSTAGGLANAVERGSERDCEAIQIFHQSPRMWRPTAYTDDDFEAFRQAMDASRLDVVVIHAVYLINCASKEREVRRKSLTSLKHALRIGDGIGAGGVVLHAGARKGEPHEPSVKRAGKAIREALESSERCPLLLENTAGTQGPLGRNFDELAELIDAAGAGKRLGACLDCCHLLASGFEIRSIDALAGVIDEFDAKVGLERLHCVHVNDSKVPLGANRDRHANLGDGELGRKGLRVFLSEPRFEDLPALIETPGSDGHGPDRNEVRTAKRLRRDGLRQRT
ncbi:MAG: deoxyribonuclease IV [Actinobacteria bacterium]|nr:MAG: deoxyribonuclease IV [Actinomycetota bacterium]